MNKKVRAGGEFGQFLRSMLEQLPISREEFARQLGWTYRTLLIWLREESRPDSFGWWCIFTCYLKIKGLSTSTIMEEDHV